MKYYKYLFWVLKPIRENVVFFVSIYFLMTLCSFFANTYARKEMFFELYVICLLLMGVPNKIRTWVKSVIYILAYILAIVDVYCLDNFGTTLNPAILMIVGETNVSEARNFLSAFFTIDSLMGHVCFILVLLIINIFVFIFYEQLKKLVSVFLEIIKTPVLSALKLFLSTTCLILLIFGGGF